MEILETIDQARSYVRDLQSDKSTVGLIPTMGALHEGHLSLVRASQSSCDHTITWIFVNPSQFAPGEDLEKYPRTIEADLQALRDLGTTAVFMPDTPTIYPDSYSGTVVTPSPIAKVLEGEHRPTHFQGVATVVLKLFNILPTSHAFFGQKDYQQLKVIEQMVHDLNLEIQIVGCPTVREQDGLAMSSRNRYLNSDQRQTAGRLSTALILAKQAVDQGEPDPKVIEELLRRTLIQPAETRPVDSIDYARVVDSQTLVDITSIQDQAVALIAAKVGNTRLIDNMILSRPQ